LAIQQHQQQPQQHRRRRQQQKRPAAGCVKGRSRSGGGHGTLRPTADATWRPEMNYCRLLGPTAIAVAVLVWNTLYYADKCTMHDFES